ncbi:MAG: hypothetical protein CL405_04440 [Acidimicrobiaceae bacterium]|nr:hypothetical protein [Acidimicrobiaceae bacterium]
MAGAVVWLVVSLVAVPVALAVVPDAPTNLAVTAKTSTTVSLSWTAASNATDYTIEYSADAFVTTTMTFFDGVSTGVTATVTGLTLGSTYSFRVKTISSGGTSVASTAVSSGVLVADVHTPNDLPVYLACPTGVVAAHGFSDIFHTPTSTAVSCIKYYGITKGTTATTYSPSDSVTRWQMALFLTRMAVPAGVTMPDGSDQGFTDIGGKSAEIQLAINQLKQLGITVGTNAAGTLFDPDSNVTREEMALFISRLLMDATVGPGGNVELGSGSSPYQYIKSNDTDHNFTDIDGVYLTETRTAIISLWNLGVSDDTTATTYNPSADMTRAAMAMFMDSALDHTNARPVGVNIQAETYRAAGSHAFSMSVTNRTSGFLPIASTRVDVFKYQHTTSTTSLRFNTDGSCAQVVKVISGTVCSIDTLDGITDTSGNLATFSTTVATATSWDYWAWTANLGGVYDDDVYGTVANKITVGTY